MLKQGKLVIFVDNLTGIQDENGIAKPMNRVGIIERAFKYRKRARVYNIRAETGSLYLYVPVNEPMSKMYISSGLTLAYADKIKTHLNLIMNSNYPKPRETS